MADALRLDGGNDHLVTKQFGLNVGCILEAKFRMLSNQAFAFISAGKSATNAYVRWNGSTLRARGSVTGATVAVPGGIDITDGQWHILQLHVGATSHKFNVDGVDTANISGNVSSPLHTTIAAFYNSFFDGDIEYIKITNNSGEERNWDAKSSTFGPGSTVLVDTIAGEHATGIGFPTDGSQWIVIGGAQQIEYADMSVACSIESMALNISTSIAYKNASISSFVQSLSLQRKAILAYGNSNISCVITNVDASRTTSVTYKGLELSTLIKGYEVSRYTTLDYEDSDCATIIDNIVLSTANNIQLEYTNTRVATAIETVELMRKTAINYIDGVIHSSIDNKNISSNITLSYQKATIASKIERKSLSRKTLLDYGMTNLNSEIENLDITRFTSLSYIDSTIISNIDNVVLVNETMPDFDDDDLTLFSATFHYQLLNNTTHFEVIKA
ncbi:hypothetical protein tloyanaT_26380 [Thalassotalea loyana]|uniref:LamG domain-containing protein n=1 Tax=Thalassotalea loyana TaxID=280483 RepID=A0ABQ6HE45_9GAMM|nr:hypothetical protein [Thalassotalea loyana]GLX86385.1 hypothetical protein tloyanaT_26380 [Thalassotalea loyana]